jgi:hypothetical protein
MRPPALRSQAHLHELARDNWGGISISPNGVHRVMPLTRQGLNTRAKRLGLVARYAVPSLGRHPLLTDDSSGCVLDPLHAAVGLGRPARDEGMAAPRPRSPC